jgi:hypothetical protein
MSIHKQETNNLNAANRCPACGHRLSMVEGTKCTVIMGDGRPGNDHECPCKKHFRQ